MIPHPFQRFPCCHQQRKFHSISFCEYVSVHFGSVRFISFAFCILPLCIGEASKINEILFGRHSWGFSWFWLRFAFYAATQVIQHVNAIRSY